MKKAVVPYVCSFFFLVVIGLLLVWYDCRKKGLPWTYKTAGSLLIMLTFIYAMFCFFEWLYYYRKNNGGVK